MSVSSRKSTDGRELIIKVSGKFDFSMHQQFRESYEGIDTSKTRFIIDLSDATYMDSSAFGMLLVLRERSGGTNADITLRGFNHSIGLILEVAKFDSLFKYEKAKYT